MEFEKSSFEETSINFNEEDNNEENYNLKQSRRWMLTINNPIWDEMKFKEVDIKNTTHKVLENYYDLSYLLADQNSDLIDYHYIEKYFENENETKIILRPFFKDVDCIEKYFLNMKEFSNLKYAIYQLEKGQEETLHIQGFLIYKSGKRFKNVKQDFPTSCIKEPNGSNSQNRDYCTKKDTRVSGPFEIGEFSEMRSRNDIKEFFESLKIGFSNSELRELYPVLYGTYGVDKIEKFRQEILQEKYEEIGRNIFVTYIYGKSRTGKTSYVYVEHGFKNVFCVENYGEYLFTGYKSQNVVLFDEYDSQIKITKLNKLLEPYPQKVRALNTVKQACFEQIYIVSNLPLSKQYIDIKEQSPEQYNAFMNRINRIIRYDDNGIKHLEKETIFEDTPENEIYLPGLTKRVKKIIIYDKYNKPKIVYDRYKNLQLEISEYIDNDKIEELKEIFKDN